MRILKFVSYIGLAAILYSCSGVSDMFGNKVEEPFVDLESTNKYFRASGKGQSPKSNVAKKKADVEAKGQLAGQVDVYIKSMADDYFNQREDLSGGITSRGKFENLTREVVNTRLLGLKKIGEETYLTDSGQYTVFIAYEMKKNDFYKALEKRIELESELSSDEREILMDFVESELEKTESED